jgi:sec-independent protein translocase protein TatA
MRLGPAEIILILVIIMIVFGVGKLPDVGKQLGRGLRDFKKYSQGADDEEVKPSANQSVAKSLSSASTKNPE